MCEVEKLKTQACARHRQKVERVEKEDSSQEKQVSVALQLTWVFLRHPVLAQRAGGRDEHAGGSQPVELSCLLELTEVGLLCDFIVTKVSGCFPSPSGNSPRPQRSHLVTLPPYPASLSLIPYFPQQRSQTGASTV